MAFDPSSASPVKKPGAFDPTTAKPYSSSIVRRLAGDTAVGLLKGAVAVPEVAVGLADLVSGGKAGQAAEAAGFRPEDARSVLDSMRSPEQRLASSDLSAAEGVGGVLEAVAKRPSSLAAVAIESLPLIGAGGVIGRGLGAVSKLSAPIRGAIGEGAVGAGSAAEGIRQQTEDGGLTAKQALLAGGSGVGTAAFGALGGRLANSRLGQRLGIADPDTLAAGGNAVSGDVQRGIAKRVAASAVSESLLEELPQSMQEQALQNLALGRPVGEGVAEAGTIGALAGGVMGGAAGALPVARPPQPAPEPPPETPPQTVAGLLAAPTLAADNSTLRADQQRQAEIDAADANVARIRDARAAEEARQAALTPPGPLAAALAAGGTPPAASVPLVPGAVPPVAGVVPPATAGEQPAKLAAMTEDGAIKRAAKLTAEGKPSEAVPHPTVVGRFAVLPVAGTAAADQSAVSMPDAAAGQAPAAQPQGAGHEGQGQETAEVLKAGAAVTQQAAAPSRSGKPATPEFLQAADDLSAMAGGAGWAEAGGQPDAGGAQAGAEGDRDADAAPAGARLQLDAPTQEGLRQQAARAEQAAAAPPSKQQADAERDAVPFALEGQSQPKPQGTQGGMFTPDGRPSATATERAPDTDQAQAKNPEASEKPAAKKYSYPPTAPGAPEWLAPMQRLVVDRMNGDITKDELIQKFADAGATPAQVTAVSTRISDDWMMGDSFKVQRLQGKRHPEDPTPANQAPVKKDSPAVAGETGGRAQDDQEPIKKPAAEAARRAQVIDNSSVNPGEYLVRDGGHNLARFKIGANGRPVSVKFFFESSQTRQLAQAAIDEFASSRQAAPVHRPEQKAEAPAAASEKQPAAIPAGWGEKNTLVTKDRAAELRARLKAKLGQLNAGIDPEMLAIGAELAAHHIEAGARKFSDFVRVMVADLDTTLAKVRPYLRGWYNGARDMMEDSGLPIDGMDDAGQVRETLATLDAGGINGGPETDSEGPQGAGPVRPVGAAGASAPDGQRADAGGAQAAADSGGVAALPPGDAGITEGNGRRDDAGRRDSKPDVGGGRAEPESGDAANGRAGAGRAGLADVRTGERGAGADDGPDGGSGGRSGEDGAGSATPAVAPEPKPKTLGNYRITDPAALFGGGPKGRFTKNRKAIEAFRAVTEEGRAPTADERDAMAAYTGWGSFGQELFKGNWQNPSPARGWEKEDAWLREHLGRDEWESAQASILNAHYTDPPTVQAIWSMIERMGFSGGRVLEPSMGIGNFYGLMPAALMERSTLAGIEKDSLTGGMARLLYPDANVQIKGYEESKTADGFYDLVIGNWPFARDTPFVDRRYRALSPSLHDYFFLKALDQVRVGGLVVGITSNGSMDKAGTSTRLALAKKADLVAAFRLPTGAFQEYAGTKVVTDIIILQKRDSENMAAGDAPWVGTEMRDTDAGQQIRANTYWRANPGNILGHMTFGSGTTAGRAGMIVNRLDDFPQRLSELPSRLPEGIYVPAPKALKINFITNNTNDRQQSVVDKDGGLYVVQGEYLAPLHEVVSYRVKSAAATAKREAEIRGLIGLRKAYGALIDAEREGSEGTEPLRKKLRTAFDKFVKAYGPINDSYGLALLRKVGDPFFPSLAALEVARGGKWAGAGILTAPTVRAKRGMDNPSVADAFVLARNESIHVDPARIAALSKRSEKDVVDELLANGSIYRTPGGNFEVADVYLSGNVRQKLREAQDAQAAGEDMAGNIEALQKIIPKDIPYYKIEAKLGAPWVPPATYERWLGELLDLNERDKGAVTVAFRLGSWRVDVEQSRRAEILNRPQATTTHGIPEYPFNRLFRAAMNNAPVTIRVKDEDGNLVVDRLASERANQKVAALRDAFSGWLWADSDRRLQAERDYNEAMNAIADVKFDGSFLAMEGMALRRGDSPFNLRQHQVNAIWRGLVNRSGIYAHEVGTGKTYTMGGLVVEARRYGIASKPLILAHNANSASVAAEIQEMYPAAKILYIDNLDPKRIDIVLRQIANDSWDAVVLPHSLIDRLALSKETLTEISKEEIAALEDAAIEAAAEDNAALTLEMMSNEEDMKKVRSSTAKELVKARNSILRKIDDMAARASRDGAVPFEELGVDMLVVDEVHEFKKPPIATRMKMKGLNTATSDRSISMMFLSDYVKRQNSGAGVHVFTGTPITNTLTEIFNLQRYVADRQMARDGVKDWDSWFNTFADSVTDVELTSTGDYEPVTRLAAFVNTADLRRMIGGYTDIVFANEMPEFSPRATATGKILNDPTLTDDERNELLNGRTENAIGRPYKKIVNSVADMTPRQLEILTELAERARGFKNADKKARRDMMLAGNHAIPIVVENQASAAGMDPRLFDIKAPDDPSLKINRAAENLLQHFNEHPLATQVVFMDRGYTSSKEESIRDPAGNVVRGADRKALKRKSPAFNMAEGLIAKLEAGGVPRDKIAVVSGTTSREKRKQIADAMNRAEVRIVIGLTATLGVGVNMQTNLRAMHHIDAPWMPGDLEQRNGRGERQGNKWNTVLEYRYITDKIDGRRWQVLAVKDRFIKEFLHADADTRVIEGDATSTSEADGADILESLSEAAGDPRLLLRQKLRADVERLESKQRMHDFGKVDASNRIGRVKQEAAYLKSTIENLRKDAATANERGEAPFSITLQGKTFDDRAEANNAIAEYVEGLTATSTRWEKLGAFKGFELYARWPHTQSELQIELRGASDHGARASVQSFEATLRNLAGRADKLDEQLATLQSSLEGLRKAASAPFPREDDLTKKRQLREQLEADIRSNPVAPPAWLRQGAPADTKVHVAGTAYVVTGHQYSPEGFFVVIDTPKGLRRLPYMQALSESGLPLYEPRPFAAPATKDRAIAVGEIVTYAAGGEQMEVVRTGAQTPQGTTVLVRKGDGTVHEVLVQGLKLADIPKPQAIPLFKVPKQERPPGGDRQPVAGPGTPSYLSMQPDISRVSDDVAPYVDAAAEPKDGYTGRNEDPYDKIETRPGTTAKQRDAGRSALDDLARRYLGVRAGGGSASVLGSRMYRGFVAAGGNQLVGQQIGSPQDLAALAQVYRDPRFETFRVIYTAGGTVVGEAGYSSRLPASVKLPADLPAQIAADKQRFGADGYWLLHNHPSGRSAPSIADVRLTHSVAKGVPGFQRHVVIDHNEYSLIGDSAQVETVRDEALGSIDFTANPEKAAPLVGATLDRPEKVVLAAKALQQIPDSHAVLMFTDSGGRTRLITQVPVSMLEDATSSVRGLARLKKRIRHMSTLSGSGGHRFVVVPSSAAGSKLNQLVVDGVFSDVVSQDGESARLTSLSGVPLSGDFMNGQARVMRVYDQQPDAGDYVREPGSDYAASPAVESFRKKAGLAARGTMSERMVGTFDRVRSTTLEQIKDMAANWWTHFRQGALDQFHGIKLAEQATLGNVPMEQSAYVAARFSTGLSSIMRGLLMHGAAQWQNSVRLKKIEGSKGLLQIFDPVKDELDDFLGWMVARRASRLMSEGRENNFTADEIAAGLDLARGREKRFKEVAQEFAAFKRSVLDVAEDAGLINPESRAVWDHLDWIPFYRVKDGDVGAAGPLNRRGFSGQSSGIKSLRGGQSAINDPLENIVMNFAHLIDASLKNNVLRQTVRNTRGSGLMDPTGYDFKPVAVPRSEIKKSLREHGVPEEMLAFMPRSLFDGLEKMWSMQPPTDKNVVRVMVAGKPQFYRVSDPLLLRAVTALTPINMPGVDVLRSFRRVLTHAVTATPDFMLRNYVRDVMSAGIVSKDKFHFADSLRGIARSYKEQGGFEDMLFAGASFSGGFVEGADPEAAAANIRRSLRKKGFTAASTEDFLGSMADSAKTYWERYREIGEAVENANREAIYEATLTAGKGTTAAAFEAKDIMDFSLRGSHAVYQFFADVLPFFNARVQGLYRLGRADPAQVARRGALLTAATMLLLAANWDDDDYEALPDWDKDNYWHFFTPAGHFRIPKPFEVGAVFSTVPERMTRWALGQDSTKKFGDRIMAVLHDQMAINPIPQAFRPAAELWANTDTFTGNPIETLADARKLPHLRYNENTSSTMRWLADSLAPMADAAGLSPKQLEHLVRGYLGTMGMYALGLSDLAVDALQGRPTRPAWTVDDYPLLGSFIRSDPPRSTVYRTDLYDMHREAKRIHDSVRALMREGDADGARELAAENADTLANYRGLNKTTERLNQIRKNMDAIERDASLSADEKRERIDRLTVLRNTVSQRAVTAVSER